MSKDLLSKQELIVKTVELLLTFTKNLQSSRKSVRWDTYVCHICAQR